MKRLSIVIVMVLVAACLVGVVIAQPGGKRGCGVKGGYGGNYIRRPSAAPHEGDIGTSIILRLKEKLALSEEQVTQLEAIKKESKEQFKTSIEAIKTKREALHKAVESGASEAELRAAANEIGKSLGDQAVLRVSTKAKVDKVLTDVQKAKLSELKKEHKGRRHERLGKGEGKPGEGQEGRRPRRGRDPEAMFSRVDADGDGAISPEEFKEHMAQMREHRGGDGMGRQPGFRRY